MDVDEAFQGIALPAAVEPRLCAAQPEDARQYPVALRLPLAQFGRVDLTGWAATDEDGMQRATPADNDAQNMPSPRSAAAVDAFAGAVERG